MPMIAPMAEWKPFSGKGTSTLTHDIICCHTMVGKLMGSWDWANQPGNSYWHFGLGADGRLLQCHPLEYRSAANLDGNWHVIPIETEDGYSDGRTSDAGQVWQPWSGSNVPSWTTAQVDKLVDVCVWLCRKYDIPPVLIPDTKPGRRGMAYHRQGIDPWRVSGGEKWSNSDGKVCPGDRRLAQWRDIVVPRVHALVTGEDDLANSDEIYKQTTEILKALRYDPGTANTEDEVGKRIKRTDEKVADVYTQTTEILKALRWDPTVANTEDDLGARVKRTEEQVAEILAILKAQ